MYSLNINNTKTIDNLEIYMLNSIKNTSVEIVKDEIKELFVPIIDLLLKEIYPYIFLSMLFVVISFLLILGIFVLLLRNNKPIIKIPFLKFS